MTTGRRAPLAFGLLGDGRAAGGMIEALRDHPDTELIALAAGDSVPDLLAGGGGRLDAIVIAPDGRPEAIAGAIRGALAAGKPTLCLALPGDAAALDECAALAERRGVPLGLPNALRSLPSTIALREALAGDETGPILSAFAAWRTSRPVADPLATLGPALLDLLAWLLPGAIERAQVVAGPLFGLDRGAAALILRGRDGIVRTIELAASLPPGHEQEDELLIEVLGEEAALRAEPFNQAITVVGETTEGRGGRRRIGWGRDAAASILDAFVTALREGGEPPGPAADLRPTLALLAELRRQAAAGPDN